MNPKDKIRNLIENGRIREALQCFLENLADGDTVSMDDVLGLSGRFSRLVEQENDGTVSVDDARLERANINKSILSFVQLWSSGDAGSILDKAIAALPVHKDADLGLIQRVNCDRIKPVRKFNQTFESKKQARQPFQFYFLCGCPNEMPDSLAERLLYEIIDKEGLDVQSSVHYLFAEEKDKRARIENLPLGIDLAGSKKKFKEYVQKRFAFANTDSFEAFVETGLPRLPYKFVFTVFKMGESEWEDAEEDIIGYLQWTTDTFKTAHPDVPTFLFFFVFEFRRLYDAEHIKPQHAAILKQLEQFCEASASSIFREIIPIKDMHLADWLSKLGVDNPNDSSRLVEALGQTLKAEDRLTIDGERRFHMKDVQPVQSRIIETFRNKR